MILFKSDPGNVKRNPGDAVDIAMSIIHAIPRDVLISWIGYQAGIIIAGIPNKKILGDMGSPDYEETVKSISVFCAELSWLAETLNKFLIGLIEKTHLEEK